MMTNQIKQFVVSRAPYDVKALLYSYTDMVKFAQEYLKFLSTHDRSTGVGSTMVVLVDNTTKNNYGLFTDKKIAIQKQGQTIILDPQDLRQLEITLGCKFKL